MASRRGWRIIWILFSLHPSHFKVLFWMLVSILSSQRKDETICWIINVDTFAPEFLYLMELICVTLEHNDGYRKCAPIIKWYTCRSWHIDKYIELQIVRLYFDDRIGWSSYALYSPVLRKGLFCRIKCTLKVIKGLKATMMSCVYACLYKWLRKHKGSFGSCLLYDDIKRNFRFTSTTTFLTFHRTVYVFF